MDADQDDGLRLPGPDKANECAVVDAVQPLPTGAVPDLGGAGLATHDVARDLCLLGIVGAGVDNVDEQAEQRR